MPVSEQLKLPSSYGSPSRILDWASVEQRLVDATRFGFEVTAELIQKKSGQKGGWDHPNAAAAAATAPLVRSVIRPARARAWSGVPPR